MKKVKKTKVTTTNTEMETYNQVSLCCKCHYSFSKDKTTKEYISGIEYTVPSNICDKCGKECETTFVRI